MSKILKFCRIDNLLGIRLCRTSSFIVYRGFSQPSDDGKSLSKTTQLDRTIENRLKNTRVQIDLGQGVFVDETFDVLEESIIKARNFDQIRKLINYNINDLQAKHIAQLYQSIDNIIQFSNRPNEELKFEILASIEFELLANRTLRLARHLEPSDALNTLLYIDNLGISADTLLCKTLMQMIRYSINDYQIDNLYKLVKYLKQKNVQNCDHSLMKALMLALPYALKHRIIYKEIDFYHVKTLLKCLEMIAFFGMDVYGDLASVEKCLFFVSKKLNTVGPKEWLNLLSFIYELDVREKPYLQKIKTVIDQCIENIFSADKNLLNNLSPRFYVNVLLKMGFNQAYYNKQLFDLIAEQAYERKDQFGIDNLYCVVMKNSNFKYVNHEMLKFFAKLIETDDPALWKSKISISNLVHFFTIPGNHEEIHSNITELAAKIIQTEKFREETSRFKMNYFFFLKNCLNLNAQLEEYLVVDWFKEHFQKALAVCDSQSKRLLFLRTMAMIHQGLFIHKTIQLNEQNQQYIREKLSPYLKEYVNLIRNGLENKSSPLVEHLYAILTKQYHPSTMSKNHVTEDGICMELKIDSSESGSIGIVLLTARNYCRNPRIWDGETQYLIKSMKNSQIRPVLVDSEVLQRLSDAEKEILLNREISFALESNHRPLL